MVFFSRFPWQSQPTDVEFHQYHQNQHLPDDFDVFDE